MNRSTSNRVWFNFRIQRFFLSRDILKTLVIFLTNKFIQHATVINRVHFPDRRLFSPHKDVDNNTYITEIRSITDNNFEDPLPRIHSYKEKLLLFVFDVSINYNNRFKSNCIVNIVTIIRTWNEKLFFFSLVSLLYLNFNNNVSIDLADLIVY